MLLYKLLKQNVSLVQIAVFLAANLLGGVIVLLGIEAYSDFHSYVVGDSNVLSSSSVVINKELSPNATISSIMGKYPTFSEEEIAELESLPSVASVGRFVAARFEVGAVLSIASARMSTDIFLEAVPDEYVIGNYTPLEGFTCNWTAGVYTDTVPVILPRNYLNLYNFGYATSGKMPQISDDMVGYLPLKLIFETSAGIVIYDAVICGLTDKFNTILVPWDFLNEANSQYAPGEKELSSRLILTTDASEFDEAALNFFANKGYVVEGDTTQLRLQNFVYWLICIIIGVGVVFALLAFVLLIVSILLLIEKNRSKIINLYSIGYSVKEISQVYRIAIFLVNVAVWMAAAVVTAIVYPKIAVMLQFVLSGFEPVSTTIVWIVAICLSIIFVIIHSCIIFVNIKKHCK